jgi:NAD(P)-dependent dehydrogenase (short-subunit alcohol dehydrogenase family)
MSILQNQTAVVTGASRGIGKGIATVLGREGANVVIADINGDGAKQTAAELVGQGLRAVAVHVDITKSDQVESMTRSVVEQFGRIDILVNNAGVVSNIHVLEFPEEEWHKTIAVNLTGVFLCSKHVGKIMVKQRSGRIINISSLSGRVGVPGQAAYCASKHGVIGLTQVLAIDLAPHVTANVICPGMNETEMMPLVIAQRAASRNQTVEEVRQGILCKTPLGRFGQPEDVGGVALFFASPMAAYVTGQAIDVDGGRRANLS